MTTFWILAVVMSLLAVAFVAPVLLRKHAGIVERMDRDKQNIAIAKERLADLENEHAAGNISDDAFGQAKQEFERALVEDLESAVPEPEKAGSGGGRWALIAVGFLVPVMAFGLYMQLGAPEHLAFSGASAGVVANANPHAQGAGQMPPVEEMVETLANKLEEDPNRPEGWYLLGRTYMSLGRFSEAANAFERLHGLVGEEPAVLVAWADASAMSQGGSMSGKPADLVQRALKLKPDNVTALWLAGRAAEEAGDYAEAVRHWEQVEALSQDDPQTLTEIRGLIASAQRAGGLPVDLQPPAAVPPDTPPPAESGQSSAGPAPAITVSVALGDAIAADTAPEDTVFVYARALEGPPMPLAVARHRVKDLPVTVTLTDEMAMMPQLKLSAFPRVRVSARVSKSGNAITQPGDLVSEDAKVDVTSTEPVSLVIAQRVQ